MVVPSCDEGLYTRYFGVGLWGVSKVPAWRGCPVVSGYIKPQEKASTQILAQPHHSSLPSPLTSLMNLDKAVTKCKIRKKENQRNIFLSRDTDFQIIKTVFPIFLFLSLFLLPKHTLFTTTLFKYQLCKISSGFLFLRTVQHFRYRADFYRFDSQQSIHSKMIPLCIALIYLGLRNTFMMSLFRFQI